MTYVSEYWMKLGNIKPKELPQRIYGAPWVYGKGHVHYSVENPYRSDFWFYRTEWDPVAVVTYTGDASKEYLSSLDLPPLDIMGVSFMMANQSWKWHTDRAREACINIAIQNGPLARTEFDDGTSFVMESGDVYCLDVTKKHRIVFLEEALPDIDTSRIVLTINLKEQYNTDSSQKIFKEKIFCTSIT